MAFMRNLVGILRQPAAAIRQQPLSVRKAFRWIQDNLLCRQEVVSRRSLLASIAVKDSSHISPSQGYMMISGSEYFGKVCDAAVEEAQDIFNNWGDQRVSGTKSYLRPLVTHENGLRPDSRILSLATSDKMIKTVGTYLGCVPVLTYVNVWYSPVIGENTEAEGSQRWHLDHEDLKQMKVFVYCSEVDDAAGPMWLVDAAGSRKIATKVGYNTSSKSKRVDDYQFTDADQVKLTGKVGDVAFVDTSSCFHLGSRKTQKPRLLIALQYLGPQAYNASTYKNPRLASAIVQNKPHLGNWLADFGRR